MGFKEFFKFTWGKLIIVAVLVLINIILYLLTLLAVMDVASDASSIMIALRSIFSPFHFIEGLGIIFNLIVYYVVACIIVWIFSKKKN